MWNADWRCLLQLTTSCQLTTVSAAWETLTNEGLFGVRPDDCNFQPADRLQRQNRCSILQQDNPTQGRLE